MLWQINGGNMSRFHKSYYEEINGKWLVWKWIPRWNRYVNTHMWDTELDAKLTIKKR